MKKLAWQESGFAVAESLLIIVIIALVGFTGWYVWHAKQTTDKDLAISTTAASTSNKAQVSTLQSANPYAGWKTYCDRTTGGCFKYPAGWKTPAPDPDDLAFAQNPDGTINVFYQQVTRGYGVGDFVTTSIDPIANSLYSVVGGYVTIANSNSPSYSVVDSSLLTEYGLVVGKDTQLGDAQGFVLTKSDSTFIFGTAMNMKYGSKILLAHTKSWLHSSDGTTARLIAESFYFNS